MVVGIGVGWCVLYLCLCLCCVLFIFRNLFWQKVKEETRQYMTWLSNRWRDFKKERKKKRKKEREKAMKWSNAHFSFSFSAACLSACFPLFLIINRMQASKQANDEHLLLLCATAASWININNKNKFPQAIASAWFYCCCCCCFWKETEEAEVYSYNEQELRQ